MNSFLKISLFLSLISLQHGDNVIKLSGIPELFSTDKIGNCYVCKSNLLTKISPTGKIVGQYSNFDAGSLFSVDASDPMQVLLFYKDFNLVIFVDSKLNTIGNPIYLDQLELSSASAVCKSKQFAIWIYDEYSRKLVHYGFSPKGILQTINLDKFGKEIGTIDFMQESGSEIYLKEKDKNIWVFDQFGGKLDQIKIGLKSDFQLKNKLLFYCKNNKVFKYNLQFGVLDSFEIAGFQSFDKVRIENNLIYILNSDSITFIPFEIGK